MALKDQVVKPAFACAMARTVARLTKEDQKTLNEWIQEGRSVSSTVKAVRAEYGPSALSDKSFKAHITGDCACTSPSDEFYGVWR
jgi:hypothetical protein